MSTRFKSVCSILALSLLLSCGEDPVNSGVQDVTAPVELSGSDKQAASRTFMGVYLLGSDLEDGNGDPERGGAGTADLQEMVAGYQALNAEQKSQVHVFVGFGGANKPGWRGIRYADMPCIVEDADDGTFGNADCYSFVNENANMGAEETLTAFLTAANQELQEGDKSTMIFWDHGASYLGFGPDMNHIQNGTLKMEDFTTSFTKTNSKYDTIGFDACLMGSIEVAQTIHPFARYMVASEELEPGHGWDYEDLVGFAGANPEASPLALGKKYVSSFINSPKHDHPNSNIKTLSLVDLSQYEPVANAVEALGQVMEQDIDTYYQPLLTATARSEGYGIQSKGSVEMGVDLVHLANNIKSRNPELAAQTDALVAAISNYVIVSERDDTRPNARGVSIFSPRYTGPVQNGSYSEGAAASKSWRGMSQQFVQKGLNDTEDPQIAAVEGCGDEDIGCFQITDNVGVSEAFSVNAVLDPSDENNVIVTSTINMLIGREEDSDVFPLLKWDGSAAVLCNGACQSDFSNLIGIPINVENLTEDGNILSSAGGTLNDQTVTFYFITDDDGDMKDFWAVPYRTDANGNPIINKEQLPIENGDTLRFENLEINISTGEETYVLAEALTLTQEPVFDEVVLPGNRFYFALALDLNGNGAISEPQIVTP